MMRIELDEALVDRTHEAEGRYVPQARMLLEEHGVHVYRWRTRVSGHALLGDQLRAMQVRPIAAPHPRSPLSFAILAHEVGHHALGTIRPRCLEEYRAWQFAFAQLERFGIDPGKRTHERYQRSMRWALYKALQRGLKTVPDELTVFLRKNEQTRVV